jgi:hypothetical protein
MKQTFTRIFTLGAILLSGVLFGQLTPEVLYYKFDGTGTSVPNLASAPPVGTATATIMGGITQGGSAICQGTLIGTGVSSSTDYLNTGWAPNLGAGSWTISMRTENITPSATLFYIFGDANTASMRCFTNGVAGANNWILRGAGMTDVYVNGGATVAPHMTTFVYDASQNNIKGYLDGVLITTVAQTAPNLTGTGPFKVMGYGSNVGAPLNGHLDEFRVYSHALSAADVAQLYNPFATSGFAGPNATFCSGDSTQLSFSWPYTTAAWSTGSTTNSTWASVTGNVIVNVSGTCGTGADTVQVTAIAPTTSTLAISTCSGSYTAPSGAVYTTSGNYLDTIPNSIGCDSIISINAVIGNSTTSSIAPVSCGTYTSPSGAQLAASGTYLDTIPNALGCDSIITINLTVNAPTFNAITASACNMYMAPSGAMYTTSGSYFDTIPNAAGCDSIITIQLSISNSTTASMSVSACGSYTAPSGAVYTSSGTIQDTIANAAGCDSVMTIQVTINTPTFSAIGATACDIYTAPSGALFNISGLYNDTITNATGCDSIIQINLVVNYTSTNTMSAFSCGPYTSPSGAIYTSTGTYTDVIPNVSGCDSIIVITLNVTTVSAGASVNGAVCTATGTTAGATFQWIDCATMSPIANANSITYTATANGSYAVITTIGNCSDTSTCVAVTSIGIEENTFSSIINLYPNPSAGNFNIDLGASYTDVNVVITDLAGRVVLAQTANNTNLIPVQLTAPAGVYLINIVSGENHAKLKVIKE